MKERIIIIALTLMFGVSFVYNLIKTDVNLDQKEKISKQETRIKQLNTASK